MELSEIALQKLLQLFPELSSYIISFKEITEEAGKEESGIRIGMFLVQFGMEYYYIPIIAKDDIVFPIDSIFGVSNQSFSPLTRSFVDKAVSSSGITIGKPSKIPGTIPQNPSVYDLVTPPRTGKFVYASSSRMVEFLSTLSNFVKKATFEKFSEDKDVYNTLHRLFGLENLLIALKPSKATPKAVLKPAVELITGGAGLTHDQVQSILEKGYALRGENTTERVAVLANDFSKIGAIKTIRSIDSGYDYEIITKSGQTKSAFLPKRSLTAPQFASLLSSHRDSRIGTESVLAIFANGDYSVSSDLISVGEPCSNHNVIKDLFGYIEPITVREISSHDTVALFTPELTLIGAYNVHGLSHSINGVHFKGSSRIPGTQHDVVINAYRNCQNVDASDPKNLLIPINTLAVVLCKDITGDLETSTVSALRKLELTTLTALGSAIDVGFDGIEFSLNGKPLGSELRIVEALISHEGIAPEKVEQFVKQAKEQRHIKIYLSKKADFEPGQIPQYGDSAPQQEETFGSEARSSFGNNLKASTQTQDPQVVESMVISELLQASDMTSVVREYLPDITQAIDRLGRTLFLARLNTDKMNESQNAAEVNSFISNLRNVYRLLGDNSIKLERMCSGPEEVQEEAIQKK